LWIGNLSANLKPHVKKRQVPGQGPVRSWFRKSLTLKISLDSLCKILSSRHLKCAAWFRANQMDSNLQGASILSSRRLKHPFPRNAWCWFGFESHGSGGSDLHRHTELCTVAFFLYPWKDLASWLTTEKKYQYSTAASVAEASKEVVGRDSLCLDS
jgi:hypothetical protein